MMLSKRLLLLLLLFLFAEFFAVSNVLAQDAGIASAIDAGANSAVTDSTETPFLDRDLIPKHKLEIFPSEIVIGEIVTWKLTVSKHEKERLYLSGDVSFGEFEIRSKDKSQKASDGEYQTEEFTVELMAFEPGEFIIPAQVVMLVSKDGKIGKFETKAKKIRVKSLIANEPEPSLKEDNGPGFKVLEKDYTLLWVILFITLAGVVVLLTLAIRKLLLLRKPKSLPPPPPPRPAEEIAIEKLDAIKADNLLDNGLFKVFHVRLSETMREYMGNRYDFDSLELSTEELKYMLKKVPISKELFLNISSFLDDTDLVKFAKVQLTMEESGKLLDGAYKVVDVTTADYNSKSGITEKKN